MHDYFAIFKIPEVYTINKQELDSSYFELLGKYHPDKASTPEENRNFIMLSGVINQGYKVLQDDFQRAAHILALHGINVNDEKSQLPIEILEQVMELKEELEDGEVNALKKSATQRDKLIQEITDLFARKDYASAAIKTAHFKYIDNILKHTK